MSPKPPWYHFAASGISMVHDLFCMWMAHMLFWKLQEK